MKNDVSRQWIGEVKWKSKEKKKKEKKTLLGSCHYLVDIRKIKSTNSSSEIFLVKWNFLKA